MHIQLISKPGSGTTGTSRYTNNLYQELCAAGHVVSLTFPQPVLWFPSIQQLFKQLGYDVQAFFASYPLKARLKTVDLYHLTAQSLASLLVTQNFPRPVVVTVLDIIPYLIRRNPELNSFRHPLDESFYRLSLAGLRRADAIVAISEYTRHTLIEELGLAPEKISVIYPIVDPGFFKPQGVPVPFRTKYRLSAEMQYILYVGTNDPRKNFNSLIQAFALLQQRYPKVRLIKVGADPFSRQREQTRILVDQLDLIESILFLSQVPDEDLPLFYNLADVLVFPSLYEGFGLPVAEAMACGTPVICSNTTSLPEVAGEAALFVAPNDVGGLAAGMEAVLSKQSLRTELSIQGLKQAARFCRTSAIGPLDRIYTKIAR